MIGHKTEDTHTVAPLVPAGPLGPHGRIGRTAGVSAAILLIALALSVIGCGPKKTLEQISTETFQPWVEKLPGTSFSFSEPATFTFTFTELWDQRGPEWQKDFMNGAGLTWEKEASRAGAEIKDIRVVFEDKMGNKVATYKAGRGLE